MLNVVKGQANTLIVTVTEKTTISSPYYLFKFKGISNQVKCFILSDTSTHPERYNEFTFTEGSTTAKTLETGNHDYTIYAQTSSSNLDPDLANEVVEVGVCNVTDTVTEIVENEITQTYVQNEF